MLLCSPAMDWFVLWEYYIVKLFSLFQCGERVCLFKSCFFLSSDGS